MSLSVPAAEPVDADIEGLADDATGGYKRKQWGTKRHRIHVAKHYYILLQSLSQVETNSKPSATFAFTFSYICLLGQLAGDIAS